MSPRFLLIPLVFASLAQAQTPAPAAGTGEPSPTTCTPVPNLEKLPLEGWSYRELTDKAATGDFRANMQAGEYWMAQYYLNREDLPLACLHHMERFFKEAARSGHPAPILMMTDPYGIFGIFKKEPLLPEHEHLLADCRQMAEKGDMDAVTALYTVLDLPSSELRRYLAPLEKKAASGNADAIAQLALIKTEWLEENPAQVMDFMRKHSKKETPALLEQLGQQALLIEKSLPQEDPKRQEWHSLAVDNLTKAAQAGHAAAMRCLTTLPNGISDTQKAELVQQLCNRGDMETILKVTAFLMKDKKTIQQNKPFLEDLLNKATALQNNNAHARYAQLLADNLPANEQALQQTAQALLQLADERAMTFLREPFTLPQKQINQLPPYAKTHKELELASQLGDVDACVQLGELWNEVAANRMDSVGEEHEARNNMRTWYQMAADNNHPLAKLRLAQMDHPGLMDKPSSEPAKTLLNACMEKALGGDFITLKGIAEFVTPEQWDSLLAPLREKARAGDAVSQGNLAYLQLFSYRSEETDYPEALAWARLSAGQGNPCGMYALGRALIYEFGLEKRMAEGDSWMFLAALKGHAEAADMWSSNNENLLPYSAMMHGMANRGHIPSLLFLANKTAYPQPHTSASVPSANPEGPQAQNQTVTIEGEEYDAGAIPPWLSEGKERKAPGPETVNPEALKFWEQAAALGSMTALDQIADYYEAIADNTKDPAAKQQMLTSAMTAASILVKQEDVRGFKRMARYYDQGIGVQPNKELYKDYVLKAADTQDPEALVEKARLLIRGEGVEPNPAEARNILSKLEQTQAQPVQELYFLLGYLHEEGLGTPQDTALAYQCYIKGTEHEDHKAMNNLGSMYERGNGVAKNLEEARRWYEQAAKLGNEDAKANVERVKEKLAQTSK